MTAHRHAQLMLQYARDAAETEKPWERWEWRDFYEGAPWKKLSFHPLWYTHNDYRRKPQTIKVTVNGKEMEFPEPSKVEPAIGATYWVVKPTSRYGYVPDSYVWDGGRTDSGFLEHRMIHLFEDSAQAHANVLNAICREAID